MSVYIYKTQNNQKDEIVLEEHEEIIDFIRGKRPILLSL